LKLLIPQNLVRKKHAEAITRPQLEEPIRAELFSTERLEQHGESLADAQRVTTSPSKGRPLLLRVLDNGRVLLESYRALARAIGEERAITPAAEWLVDNYHIVDEQLREIHDDLPPGYYRLLPKLATGPFAGYPRVFGVAWAFVAHTDSRFDPEMLRRFARAYQRAKRTADAERERAEFTRLERELRTQRGGANAVGDPEASPPDSVPPHDRR